MDLVSKYYFGMKDQKSSKLSHSKWLQRNIVLSFSFSDECIQRITKQFKLKNIIIWQINYSFELFKGLFL